VNPKNWLHSADIVSINDTKDDSKESLWQVFRDGSKSELGVGSGVAVFTGQELVEQRKFRLDNRCSNNQVEQLAILKALEAIEMQQVNYNKQRTAVIHTNSKITLDSIRNAKNHNHLVEEIRKRTVNMNKHNWKTEFEWVKAHVRIYSNKIADRLVEEATQNNHITYSRVSKCAIKKIHLERKYKKMAELLEVNNKRSDY
jgi:ribonuclease HI